MKIPTTRIFVILLFLAAPAMLPAADSLRAIADRTLIREFMDRYGVVHDWAVRRSMRTCSPPNGEIAVAAGGPAIVTGRQALIAQARRDHEGFDFEPAANGKATSIMRHPRAVGPRPQRDEHHQDLAEGQGYVRRIWSNGSTTQNPTLRNPRTRHAEIYRRARGGLAHRIARGRKNAHRQVLELLAGQRGYTFIYREAHVLIEDLHQARELGKVHK